MELGRGKLLIGPYPTNINIKAIIAPTSIIIINNDKTSTAFSISLNEDIDIKNNERTRYDLTDNSLISLQYKAVISAVDIIIKIENIV